MVERDSEHSKEDGEERGERQKGYDITYHNLYAEYMF